MFNIYGPPDIESVKPRFSYCAFCSYSFRAIVSAPDPGAF